MNKSRRYWGLIFVAPQAIGLIIFSLIPLAQAFFISFTKWDGMQDVKEWVGLGNYIYQFSNPDFSKSMLNTVKYMVVFVPLNIILALFIAMALKNIIGKTIYRLIYFMPVVTGSVSVGVIWTWLLNADTGLVNMLLKLVNGPQIKWLTDPKLVLISIALVSIWWNMGYNMVIFLAGLQSIPLGYYEAAAIDGAGKLKQFKHITLPMISPTIFFTMITTIISSFQVFDQAFVMTKGGPAKASLTFVFYIYEDAFRKFTMGRASASAMVLFVIILVITGIQMILSKKWVTYDV